VASVIARRRPSAVLISGVNLAVLIEAATSVDVLDDAAVARLVRLGREALADVASVVASRTS
jgi:mannose/fructose-specific phosphotransferase system component IIA